MWIKYAFISFLLLSCTGKKDATPADATTDSAATTAVDGTKEEDCDEKAKKEQLKKIETLDLSKTDPGCTLDE
jgi:hypothetical protein